MPSSFIHQKLSGWEVPLRRKTMPKSVQFALAAGSMLIFASAATAQDVTVGFNPLFEIQPPIAFQVQPQIGQEYPLYSVLPSMMWRTPVMPLTWDMQAVVPFTLEEKRPLDRASKPN
jgi:hypothetical protein